MKLCSKFVHAPSIRDRYFSKGISYDDKTCGIQADCAKVHPPKNK